MPISSGANGWPNVYRAFQKFKSQKTSPSSPPPAYTETQPRSRDIYQRHPHSSRPPPPRGSGGIQGTSSGPETGRCGCSSWCGQYGSGNESCGSRCYTGVYGTNSAGNGTGCCGSNGGGACSASTCNGGACSSCCGSGGAEPCCCFCGGSALYTTGVAGANAGCCQGGLFSSKSATYPASQSNYVLQNQGQHRCCACVTGVILGLLLLGLIVGCLLALDPYLQNKSKVSSYLANNPGAYQVGDYIVVPKETHIDYYKVNGAEEPCNPYNNASDATDHTSSGYSPLELLPDCDSLTTSIEWTYSVPITGPTTTAMASARPAATSNVCVMMTAALLAMHIEYYRQR